MSIRQLQPGLGSTLFYAGLGAAAGATVSVLGVGLLRGLPDLVAVSLSALGLLPVVDSQAYWYTARAGGIIAFLLLWLGALSGVLMSGKQVKGIYVFGLHEFLPVLAMVFAALHALVLLGDRYTHFSLLQIVVPFLSPYRPLWTGLGVLALYLGTAVAASFYLRRWIGRRAWRLLHYATYLVFGLALTHGVLAGTDSSIAAVRWMYVGTGAALLFATVLRVLMASKGGMMTGVKQGKSNQAAALRTSSSR